MSVTASFSSASPNDSFSKENSSSININSSTNVINKPITSTPLQNKATKNKEALVKFSKPIPNLTTDRNMTNTGTILQIILENDPIVYDYDKIRKQYKASPDIYRETYKVITARVEVKLVHLHENLKLSIKNIETKCLENNKNLSLIPENENEKVVYDKILKKMKLLLKLKKDFKF